MRARRLAVCRAPSSSGCKQFICKRLATGVADNGEAVRVDRRREHCGFRSDSDIDSGSTRAVFRALGQRSGGTRAVLRAYPGSVPEAPGRRSGRPGQDEVSART